MIPTDKEFDRYFAPRCCECGEPVDDGQDYCEDCETETEEED